MEETTQPTSHDVSVEPKKVSHQVVAFSDGDDHWINRSLGFESSDEVFCPEREGNDFSSSLESSRVCTEQLRALDSTAEQYFTRRLVVRVPPARVYGMSGRCVGRSLRGAGEWA